MDQSEENRTSRASGWKQPLFWLENNSHLISRKAQLGYKATVLAYFMSRDRPLTAAWYILQGLVLGRVPFNVSVRQVARCFLPRRFYRSMVNRVVAMKGLKAT